MKALLPAVCALTLQLPAFAGSPVVSADGKKAVIEPCNPADRVIFGIDGSYTAESDFKGHDVEGDAFHSSVEFGYRIPLGAGWPDEPCGEWNLRLGVAYNRHDFSQSGSLPIPNHIQTLAGVIALEYIVNGQVGLILDTRPGFYFENELSEDTFDAPTYLVAAHRFSPTLGGFLGVAYGKFRTYPLLPVAGFVWTPNDQWTVSLVYPNAQLSYKVSEQARVYVGAEHVGDSVRVDRAEGRPGRLDHGVLSYSEYRAGVGVEMTMGAWSGELAAGWSFGRDFDYHRVEKTYNSEGAPYVKLALSAAF